MTVPIHNQSTNMIVSSTQDPELIHPSEACVLHFPAAMTICSGQTHPHVFLAQAMFQALCSELPCFQSVPISGAMNPETVQNIRQLQACANLPETGDLNKLTWNRLNRLYRAMFDRNHLPSQG